MLNNNLFLFYGKILYIVLLMIVSSRRGRVPTKRKPFNYREARQMVLERPLKPTVNSLDKRIKRINREVELKWIDTIATIVGSNTGAGVNAAAVLLNGVAQGTSAITRLGDRISLTSLQIRMIFSADVDNLASSQHRFIVVLDKQTNAAAPDISTNNDTSVLDISVVTLLYNAPYNRRTSDRYKILYDKRVDFNPLMATNTTPGTGAVTTVASIGHSKKFKKQLQHQARYNGAGATVADIVSGSIFCFLISDFAQEFGQIQIGARVYFKDS